MFLTNFNLITKILKINIVEHDNNSLYDRYIGAMVLRILIYI